MTAYIIRWLPLVLFPMVLTLVASGQIAGGLNETVSTNLGGNNYIAGTVYFKSGRPVEMKIRIRLVPMVGGEIAAMTDDRGRFVFSQVGEGTYTIIVEGDRDYDAATRQVDIERKRNPIPQTYTVSIRLNDRVTPATEKPGVVRADSETVSKTAMDLYGKAKQLSNNGEHRAAITELSKAVSDSPEFVDAHNELGVQYMRLNELEKAGSALTAALKIKPNSFEPTLNYGIVLFRTRKNSEAEAQFRKAIEQNARSAVAHFYLGRTLTALERYDEAEKELNRALELGGKEMNEAHRMLANLYLAKGDDKRAVAALEQYLKLVPQAPDAAKLRDVIRQLGHPK